MRLKARPMPKGEFVPWNPARPSGAGYVVTSSGCHLWTGSLSSSGYGRVRFDGRDCPVHRLRYEREVGPVPAGLVLDQDGDVWIWGRGKDKARALRSGREMARAIKAGTYIVPEEP
jgi:hypothetical protein